MAAPPTSNTPIRDDQSSDYESSCSSVTVPESSRSWMSNLSFGSRRSSVSLCSSTTTDTFLSNHMKPHKANQTAWEAMKLLQRQHGRVGLEHFRLLRRVGSGDIGNVYLCQIRNPTVGLPQCFYAMKVVDKEALAIRKKLQRAVMEKEILAMIDHPFLPTLYADFDASHFSCLVMEFCPGGDLHVAQQRQPGKRFSVSSAKFYAGETLLAIEYLHMMGIVYRDLKPENVLVREDGHIMLSDFDLSFKCDVVPKLIKSKTKKIEREASSSSSSPPSCSRSSSSSSSLSYCISPVCAKPIQPVLSCFSRSTKSLFSSKITTTTITEHADDHDHDHDHNHVHNQNGLEDNVVVQEVVVEPINARSRSFVGTHEYLAPEVISGQGHGSAVDWWTFGVFLYEMLYGRTPFKGENNERTLVNILKQPLTFPRLSVATAKEYEEMVKVQDLISRLLVKNPRKRIGSLQGSAEIKRHEFFRGVNWALIRSVKPPEVPRDIRTRMMVMGGGGGGGGGNNNSLLPRLTKKEREAPYQIPLQHLHHQHHHHQLHHHHHHHRQHRHRHHFDYF